SGASPEGFWALHPAPIRAKHARIFREKLLILAKIDHLIERKKYQLKLSHGRAACGPYRPCFGQELCWSSGHWRGQTGAPESRALITLPQLSLTARMLAHERVQSTVWPEPRRNLAAILR